MAGGVGAWSGWLWRPRPRRPQDHLPMANLFAQVAIPAMLAVRPEVRSRGLESSQATHTSAEPLSGPVFGARARAPRRLTRSTALGAGSELVTVLAASAPLAATEARVRKTSSGVSSAESSLSMVNDYPARLSFTQLKHQKVHALEVAKVPVKLAAGSERADYSVLWALSKRSKIL